MRVIAQGYNWYYSEGSQVFHPKDECACLLYIFHSPVTVTTEQHTWNVDEGDILFLDRGEMHTITADQSCFMLDWIVFEMDEADKFLFERLEIPFSEVIHSSNAFILSNMVMYSAFVADLEKENFADACTQFLMSILHCASALLHNPDVDNIMEKTNPEIRALRLEIYANPQEDWSVERMCSMTHRSPSGLYQLYRKLFGVGCTEDVINARISQAQYLLRSTTLRVSEIAFRCGYSSYGYFARQFKEKSGLSPADYRRIYTPKN